MLATEIANTPPKTCYTSDADVKTIKKFLFAMYERNKNENIGYAAQFFIAGMVIGAVPFQRCNILAAEYGIDTYYVDQFFNRFNVTRNSIHRPKTSIKIRQSLYNWLVTKDNAPLKILGILKKSFNETVKTCFGRIKPNFDEVPNFIDDDVVDNAIVSINPTPPFIYLDVFVNSLEKIGMTAEQVRAFVDVWQPNIYVINGNEEIIEFDDALEMHKELSAVALNADFSEMLNRNKKDCIDLPANADFEFLAKLAGRTLADLKKEM